MSESVSAAYGFLFRGVLVVMAAYALCGIIRAIVSKNISDRVMSVNMVGSAVIASILVLAAMLDEPYLPDVALIYVLVNVVSVVILNRVFVTGKNDGGSGRGKNRGNNDNGGGD